MLGKTPKYLVENFKMDKVLSIAPQSVTWKIIQNHTNDNFVLKIYKKQRFGGKNKEFYKCIEKMIGKVIIFTITFNLYRIILTAPKSNRYSTTSYISTLSMSTERASLFMNPSWIRTASLTNS